jgi:hypothetical protein
MSKERFRGHPGYDTLTDEEREEMRERAKRQRGDAESGAVKESDFDSASQPETVLEWVRVRERETSGVNDYEDWEPKDAVIGFTIRKYFNPTLVEIHFSGGKKTRSFDVAKSLANRLESVLDSAQGDG